MRLILQMAWRNLWRNRRRTIITVLAVTFAVFLSVAMRGLQLGTYELNIKNAVELYSGYLQVQRGGYQQNPSLQKSFHMTAEIESALRETPGITGFAPRVLGDGLVSFRENSQGAAIMAMRAAEERRVSKMLDKLHEGRIFATDSTFEIVVGYKLLQNLQANIGDRVVILSQGFDGTLGNMFFTITGTMKTGSNELDGAMVLMGLDAAQELLSMYGRINVVAVSVDDFQQMKKIQSQLSARLPGDNLAVLNWEEIMPDLQQAIELDNIGGLLFLAILIVVVAFGIMNTVLMSVTERFREFGVTLAVGMPQRKLLLLVFFETVFIILIGLLLGNLLAYAVNAYIVSNPIVFGGEFAELYIEYGFLPRLESSLRPSIFFDISVTILLISLLCTLYPLLKLQRLEPLKGIRYT